MWGWNGAEDRRGFAVDKFLDESSDQVSIDLKEYLLATLAISIRYTRLASGKVIFLTSDGLEITSISHV